MDYLEYEYEGFADSDTEKRIEIHEYSGADVLFWSIVSFTGGAVAASLWFYLVMVVL